MDQGNRKQTIILIRSLITVDLEAQEHAGVLIRFRLIQLSEKLDIIGPQSGWKP